MSNRHTSRLKMGASLGAIALLTMPGVALAQDDALETVVVTGTLIKGINPVGTNLVTFDAKAIQASGAQSTNQILSNIPQITTAFNTMVNDTTGATGGGARTPTGAPAHRRSPGQARPVRRRPPAAPSWAGVHRRHGRWSA